MKYLITWDAGYGPMADVVEATSQEAAEKMAHDACMEDSENNALYDAEPLTEDNAGEWGFEGELKA